MIGKIIRSPRHINECVEGGNEANILAVNERYNIALRCLLLKTKKINRCKSNMLLCHTRDFSYDYDGIFEYVGVNIDTDCDFSKEKISSINSKCNKLYLNCFSAVDFSHGFEMKYIVLPDDFDITYNSFCCQNKKLLSNIFTKYCSSDSPISQLFYALSNGHKNIVLWALSSYYKNKIPLSTIISIIGWCERYPRLICKLSKGTITAYKTWGDITMLIDEMINIRRSKRANDTINSFNTSQKKALRSIELCEKDIKTLSAFKRLSINKQINFIKKMSSVDDAREIIKQMSFLCSIHFDWNRESLLDFMNNISNMEAKVLFDSGNIVLVHVFSYESVKYLAKTTNWCISKNKSYWDSYISNDRRKQYVIFDFNKKEDDELSIVGFTVVDGKIISNAHSFTNNNLVSQSSRAFDHLKSIFQKNIDITSIIKNDNIPLDLFMSFKSINFKWNRDSVIEYIKKSKARYQIFHDKNGILAMIVMNIDINSILNRVDRNYNNFNEDMDSSDYYSDDSSHKFFILFNFNIDDSSYKKIMYAQICKMDGVKEMETCGRIKYINDETYDGTFFDLINQYNMPNILRRPTNKETITEAFESGLPRKVNEVLSGETQESIRKLSRSDKKLMISYITETILFYSYDYIDVYYNNGLKLSDLGRDSTVYLFDRLTRECLREYSINCSKGITEMPSYSELNNFRINPSTNHDDDYRKFMFYLTVIKEIIHNEDDVDFLIDVISKSVLFSTRDSIKAKYYKWIARLAFCKFNLDDINNANSKRLLTVLKTSKLLDAAKLMFSDKGTETFCYHTV